MIACVFIGVFIEFDRDSMEDLVGYVNVSLGGLLCFVVLEAIGGIGGYWRALGGELGGELEGIGG